MSETVARQRPSVGLDDFERRLRQAQGAPQRSQAVRPNGYDDDPLTELARLVGERHDPYEDVFAREAAPRPDRPRAEGGGQPASVAAPSPRFTADFAAIEAGLKGTSLSHPELYSGSPDPSSDPHQREPQVYAEHDGAYSDEPYADDRDRQDWASPAQPAAVGRSRRPIYAMVAAIAVGVIGIGVAFAYKGASSSPREIKTIVATAGPTKIQPPADATTGSEEQDVGALDKGPAAPTKLVSREEQPVDLSQAVQDNAARNSLTQGTDASSVPVPLSPGQVRDGASTGEGTALSGAAAPPDITQAFGAGMPVPKKVKVVSVRPDGTILPTSDSQQASLDADVAAKSTAAAPLARSAKSTSRVSTSKPRDVAANANDPDKPKPARVAKKAKPLHVASAEVDDRAATAEQAAPDQAATDAGEPKPAGTGSFAVQLAAPGSETEAKAATSRLGKKFAGALSGYQLGFHKADSNGRSVYRVRVGSLSREDASGLCAKVKSQGGTCFVAKN